MSYRAIHPFPGLRPFEPDEDHLFFGRERATDDLLRRLRRRRFLAVVGSSGSGKSSLVRTGLIPALEGGYMVGGDPPEGMLSFEGIGYTGYDNIRKRYVSVWMDTTATSIVFEIVGPILTKIALRRAGEIPAESASTDQ